MSIASEITRLQGCKSDIRSALVNKGITSASTHNMADFATDISNITAGGATITVTYDSSFYNKTITCSNGSKTYTKTTTSSGSTEFSVSDEGTWTITCNGVSVSLDVTLNYSTQIKPTGSTATPVNDIQTWLKCGGIFNKNYTTINQVLADTTTLLALISDSNAVDYMVRSTNWANSVCANATAMTDIGANNYCANTLLSDSTWRTAICDSTYFESVLDVKVPTMTSDTTPSGEASASSTYGGYEAWKAFNPSQNNGWLPKNGTGTEYIQYNFENPTKINKITTKNYASASGTITAQLLGSNDKSTYTLIQDDISIPTNSTGATNPIIITNNEVYLSYRLRYISHSSGMNYTSGIGIKLQFYGRA